MLVHCLKMSLCSEALPEARELDVDVPQAELRETLQSPRASLGLANSVEDSGDSVQSPVFWGVLARSVRQHH